MDCRRKPVYWRKPTQVQEEHGASSAVVGIWADNLSIARMKGLPLRHCAALIPNKVPYKVTWQSSICRNPVHSYVKENLSSQYLPCWETSRRNSIQNLAYEKYKCTVVTDHSIFSPSPPSLTHFPKYLGSLGRNKTFSGVWVFVRLCRTVASLQGVERGWEAWISYTAIKRTFPWISSAWP